MSRIIMFVASASSRPLYSQKLYGRQNCPSGLCHGHHVTHKKENKSNQQQHHKNPAEHSHGLSQPQTAQSSLDSDDVGDQLRRNPESHAELPITVDDLNSTKVWTPHFHDKNPRRKFVRNVYTVLTLQFMAIIGLMAVFLHGDTMRRWTFEDRIPFFSLLGICFVLLIFLFWKDCLRMKAHLNVLCLIVLIFMLSLLLAAAVSTFGVKSIPLAVGMIAILCLLLAVANLQSTVDFTEVLPGIALIFHIILITFILLIIFFGPYFPMLSGGVLAALAIVVYIVLDLHRMMSNDDHCYVTNPDHLIYAVLNLYVDILGIFLNCFNCSLVTSGERNTSTNLSHV